MKKSIFLILFSIFSSIYASFEQMYERSGIIPDVIDQVPSHVLIVTYDNQIVVDFGKELTPTEVQKQPLVSWNAEPNTFYTLLMVDPDAPTRRDPKFREVKHWFVGNIFGNDLSSGEHIAEYIGSGPPRDTGLHRYIFLLFKQQGKIDFSHEPKSAMYSRDHRLGFNTRKFTAKYSLGSPIAGNFYQAQWDPYVEERNKKIAKHQAESKNIPIDNLKMRKF